MGHHHLLGATALALAIACGGAVGVASAATTLDLGAALDAPTLDDAVLVESGGTTVMFTQATEDHEFFQSLQSLVTPDGFTDATIFLTNPNPEPGEAPLFGLYSDGFTINSTNGHLNIYFISAGATTEEENMFVTDAHTFVIPETGKFQDVSSFFGQSDGFAQILSDVAVPEPETWALMLIGFGGLGGMIRRRRRLGPQLA